MKKIFKDVKETLSDNDFDDFFGDFEGFNSNFVKRFLNEIDKAAKDGRLKGRWKINQIDRPDAKGYIIQGRFGLEEPLEPLEPFEPLEPIERPLPDSPFDISESSFPETKMLLMDVFEEEKAIKIYLQVQGESKENIQLNNEIGKVEVKGKNFSQAIDIPTNSVDLKKASLTYNNGVLEIIIPKKEKTFEKDIRDKFRPVPV